MTLAERLRMLADALPPGGAVMFGRSDLLTLLDADAPTPAAQPCEVDLTIPDVAGIFRRGDSTIRTWLSQGRFPGAYKLGREWRVPRSDLAVLQDSEASRFRAMREKAPDAETTDLGAWRSHIGAR